MSAFNEVRPWERDDGESEDQWELFRSFRDMGTGRSVQGVAHKHGYGMGSAQSIARRNKWAERAKAWDLEQDRAFTDTFLSTIRELAQRQARLAMRLADFSEDYFTAADASQARTSDAVRAAEASARLTSAAADLGRKNDTSAEAVRTLAGALREVLSETDQEAARARLEGLEAALRAMLPAEG